MSNENKCFQFKADDVSPEGIFKGYASVFGGKPDSYGDIIKFGAFTDTIVKGGKFRSSIKMLFNHNKDIMIGKYTQLEENSKGLSVIGQLALETNAGHDAHVLMKMGAIDAMSIGWEPLREDATGKAVAMTDAVEFDEKKNIRLLKKIDLWEISPVTFPAQPRASITDVKSAIESAKNERELEESLCEAGVSRSAAKFLVSKCKSAFRFEVKNENTHLLAALKSLRDTSVEIAVHSILNSVSE
jgi:hypothetical protein